MRDLSLVGADLPPGRCLVCTRCHTTIEVVGKFNDLDPDLYVCWWCRRELSPGLDQLADGLQETVDTYDPARSRIPYAPDPAGWRAKEPDLG